MPNVDIGSTFRAEWSEKETGIGYGDVLTVLGYIYYADTLYYVCANKNGNTCDVHHEDVEGYTDDQENKYED